MNSEYYTTKWLRKLEIFSLLVTIIATPLFFIVLAVLAFYSPGPNGINYVVVFIGVIMSIATIFTIDILFGSILKHYIYHQEERRDVVGARVSSIFVFGNIMLYIILFIAILRFY